MNTRVGVNSLLVSCVFMLSACGVVQSERIESMDSMDRYERLSEAENDQLCRGFTNPIIKEQTKQQIEDILRARGVTECRWLGDITHIETEEQRRKRLEPCPDCLDILGFIPDVTQYEDFKEKAKIIVRRKEGIGVELEIGGFTLPCAAEFTANTFRSLLCTTGKRVDDPKHKREDNEYIHGILRKGYTDKLGPPVLDEDTIVRNRFGADFIRNEVWWMDSRENALILRNMEDSLTEGKLILISAERQRTLGEGIEERDANRQF